MVALFIQKHDFRQNGKLSLKNISLCKTDFLRSSANIFFSVALYSTLEGFHVFWK